MRRLFSILVLSFVLSSLFADNLVKKREMRGAWIATVANIDWPVNRTNGEAQQKELIEMLDSLAACRINAVFFQVRPCADALYESELEPWSSYVSGQQGKQPTPFYDPLQMIVKECHARCMEAHAWINPYRVTNGESEDKLSKNHIYFQRPEMFVKYGGKIYFNPGLQETRDYLATVVMDIVLRYDIDGVHMDDYFYPYKVAGADFPDLQTFRENNRGIYDRKAWRRDNVNLVVEHLYNSIHAAKPWVQFGVSPFGIWRNDFDDLRGSATVTTCTNYDELSADVLTWLEKGWLDYSAPQLYWEMGKPNVDFKMLSQWWSKYTYGRNLYVGLYASGLAVKNDAAWKKPNEVSRQITYSQSNPEIDGYIFYSAKYLKSNTQGIADSLRNMHFMYPALTPVVETSQSSPSTSPKNIRVITENGKQILRWMPVEKKGGHAVSYYVVYLFKGIDGGDDAKPSNILKITPNTEICLSDFELLPGEYSIQISSVNRFKQESKLSKKVRYRVAY